MKTSRMDQPGSKPVDIPDFEPNPAYQPEPELPRVPDEPVKAPEKVPEKTSYRPAQAGRFCLPFRVVFLYSPAQQHKRG
jgi:hypothetical protein